VSYEFDEYQAGIATGNVHAVRLKILWTGIQIVGADAAGSAAVACRKPSSYRMANGMKGLAGKETGSDATSSIVK